ncbi:MAG: hypothetical protein AMJ61_12940, partial [Desulfobacterales bacterium SG8_35_2]
GHDTQFWHYAEIPYYDTKGLRVDQLRAASPDEQHCKHPAYKPVKLDRFKYAQKTQLQNNLQNF